MARNSLAILPLLFFVFGCQPETKSVSVDLDVVLRESAPATPPPIRVPSPPPTFVARTLEQPGLPPVVIADPSPANAANVVTSIERQQKEARAALERRLRDFYQGQIAQFRLSRIEDIDALSRQKYDEASEKIRRELEALAEERGPRTARLSLLVGWPDPNPESVPPVAPLRPVPRQRFEDAKQLRAEIEALEAAYKTKVASILREVEDVLAERQQSIQLEVQRFTDDLNSRAEKEAAEQVRTTVKDLGLQLTETNPVTLPATPKRSVSVPTEPPLPPVPPFGGTVSSASGSSSKSVSQVRSNGVPESDADRRRLLEHELGIWLGLNRLTLQKGARDATTEFQKWRKTYRAGL